MKVPLPKAVAAIYKAVEELSDAYPGRKFTPDGHLVGSIGEVVAAHALGLTLHSSSHPAHDAVDQAGRQVQIKMTAGNSISMYADCDRLVVLKVVSPHEAEIVYDGHGAPAWAAAGKMQKNGQRPIRLSKLRLLSQKASFEEEGRVTSKSQIGDLNRNRQKLLEKTKTPGNDHAQYVWIVECNAPVGDGICGHLYGVNGSDFFQRKCPICQGGRPGLSYLQPRCC